MNKVTPELIERMAKKELLDEKALLKLRARLKAQLVNERLQQEEKLTELYKIGMLAKQ